MSKNKMIEAANSMIQTSINDLQYKDAGLNKDEKFAYARGQIDLMYELELINDNDMAYWNKELIEVYEEVK